MRTHYKCLRIFVKLRAVTWRSVNDDWNVQINPLAAAVLRPWFWTPESLVVHTKSGYDAILLSPTNVGRRFP
ncbi:MAG TPA: hypothetical protein VE077_00665, partial [Candidatus Methylomirabilis sp.]|nr:hypothetical protein [Candidatus Methylomirabilis sp.]